MATPEPVDSQDARLCPDDSASQAGRSSIASSRSVDVRRMELIAAKAAILAEASVAKEQQDLEQQQFKLRQKMEELDIKKRLAAVEAEDKILASNAVDGEDVFVQADPEVAFKLNPSNLNPTASEFVPDQAADVDIVSWLKQSHERNEQIVDALKLPSVQLTYFDGDPLGY